MKTTSLEKLQKHVSEQKKDSAFMEDTLKNVKDQSGVTTQNYFTEKKIVIKE